MTELGMNQCDWKFVHNIWGNISPNRFRKQFKLDSPTESLFCVSCFVQLYTFDSRQWMFFCL